MRSGSSITTSLDRAVGKPRVIQSAIAIAAIFLSIILAWRGTSGLLAYLLIGAGPAFVAILLYQRQPALGLMALILSGLFIPLAIGTGTGTTLNPVILLVPPLTFLWLADMALRQGVIRLHRHRSVYLLLLFNSIALLSFIAGQLPWYNMAKASVASQLGGLAVFLISSAAFLLSAHTLNELWLERIVYVFIAGGALYVVGNFVPVIGAVVKPLFTSGSQGSVFWIWLSALPAALALFNSSLNHKARLLLAAIAIMSIARGLLLGIEWASGWAPPILALALLLWLKFPRGGWLFPFVGALVFIGGFDRIWPIVTSSESWRFRWQAWNIVLETMRVNPLLGLGPSNYYFYVQQYTIFGWGSSWNMSFNSHNNWVDLIAQTGILGTAVFTLFIASLGRVGWRLYRQLPNGFARAYAAACIAGLIATMVSGMLGDWFLPFVYNIGLEGMRSSVLFWVFMGGLLMLFQNSSRHSI